MSVRSAARLNRVSAPTQPADRSGSDLAAARQKQAGRRRLNVLGGRVLVAVVVLGGRELGSRIGVIDKFFWSQPSEIASTSWRWFTERTDLGPLWEQDRVTMEKTVGSFLVASMHGVIFAGLLRRNSLLA